MRAYVEDARERLVGDDAVDLQAGSLASLPTRAKQNRALADTVRSLAAVASGLDPANPYVTQRPGQEFLWYEFKDAPPGPDDTEDYGPAGDRAAKRRRLGADKRLDARLAKVDPALSCDAFTDAAWIKTNRPDWPPSLQADAQTLAKKAPKAVTVPFDRNAPKLEIPDETPLEKLKRTFR